MIRTKRLRPRSTTPTAQAKDMVQGLVRQVVIVRDGGCILRGKPQFGPCNGYRQDGQLVLQANHLVTRGKNVGYADTRLIVCMCKGHHKGYHSARNEEYKITIRKIIGPARRNLWERAEQDRTIHHMTAWDWEKEVLALQAELRSLTNPPTSAK